MEFGGLKFNGPIFLADRRIDPSAPKTEAAAKISTESGAERPEPGNYRETGEGDSVDSRGFLSPGGGGGSKIGPAGRLGGPGGNPRVSEDCPPISPSPQSYSGSDSGPAQFLPWRSGDFAVQYRASHRANLRYVNISTHRISPIDFWRVAIR